MVYLIKGPGSAAPSTTLVPVPPPIPPLKTNLAFESHIIQEAAGKLPQNISSSWDERRMWGENAPRTWQGLTPQERKTIMLDIYLNNPQVSACIDVISKRIFSGGYVVEKIDEEAKDNRAHLDTLNEFLLRINPDWDFNQLGRSLVQDKLIFGECYSELTWKNGQPWQLFKIDAIPMGYEADRYGQIERFYQELEWSRQRNYLDPQNIIRWWFPHPRASIDPFAPAEKVSDAVLIDKKMMVWMTSFFQKGAKFSYYFKGVADRDEADRFLVWFRQNFMGEKNAHIPPITWGNAEIAPLGNSGALEMDFQKGLDRMRTIVFAAFGVPPAAVSIIESGNIGGGTGEDQDKSLIFNACDPVKQAFLEKLNDRIVKRGFGITDYRIGLKYADYRSDESVAKVEDLRIKNGSRTVDEIRLESGKKPYRQGGSVPFIWSTKEVVPLARLEDLEDEQRENAQVALQTAQANADLAATKAKQAKEPPSEQPVQMAQQGVAQNATPDKQPQGGKNAGQDEKLNSGKPAQKQESKGANTGAMVALMIPPEIGQQIALPGGEPVEDLHITLAFLGEATDIPAARLPILRQALGNLAKNHYSLQGCIAGLGRFDAQPGELTPLIALPDIPGLAELRQALVSCLHDILVPVSQEHGYTPHITLAYLEPDVDMPALDIPAFPLSFDQICLVLGDERTSFPLLGQKQEDYNPVTKVWEPDDTDQQIQLLRSQGVTHVEWRAHPGACDDCLANDGQVVKLGEAFKGGQRLVIGHPHCDCEPIYLHSTQEEQQDKDATQKLPVIKFRKPLLLTEEDTWEGQV